MATYSLGQKILKEPNLPKTVVFEIFDQAPETTYEWGEDYEEKAPYPSWESALTRLLETTGEPEKSDEGDTLPVLVGVAPWFSESDSKIVHLAFATSSRVVVFQQPVDHISSDHEKSESLKKILSGSLLKNKPHLLVGFELASTVLACFRDFNLASSGVDIVSTLFTEDPNVLPSVAFKMRFDNVVDRNFEDIWRTLPGNNDRRPKNPTEESETEPTEQKRARQESERVGWRAWMAIVTASTNTAKIHGTDPISSIPREGLTEEVRCMALPRCHIASTRFSISTGLVNFNINGIECRVWLLACSSANSAE
jgi:hypothetical protein